MNAGHCAKIIIVRVEAIGRLALGTVNLSLFQLWTDGADDARRDFVLQIKNIPLIAPSKRSAHKCAPVEASISCPVIRTRLSGFTHAADRADNARRARERSVLASSVLPLKTKLEFRAITKSQRNCDSAVMRSSVMPSAKYSCSGSPEILLKGRTAMEALSGDRECCRRHGSGHLLRWSQPGLVTATALLPTLA